MHTFITSSMSSSPTALLSYHDLDSMMFQSTGSFLSQNNHKCLSILLSVCHKSKPIKQLKNTFITPSSHLHHYIYHHLHHHSSSFNFATFKLLSLFGGHIVLQHPFTKLPGQSSIFNSIKEFVVKKIFCFFVMLI